MAASPKAFVTARKAFALDDDVAGRGVVYLAAASRTPMLRKVYDVGVEAVGRKLLPWRIDEEGGAAAEAVRDRFAKLIGARSGEEVALTPSCSYAVSLAAANLRAVGRVPAGAEVRP
ncbi:hypothetical protein T492DRAFT_1058105 [Pavlovales sp. CCMP2436]|nr:hypothetical protein T492DRAFT_1058105 [Pavlovales sp. CCMP2436]